MIIILCLFGIFLSALSVASASDAVGNETFTMDVGEAENDIILTSGEDNAILGVPSQSFNDLNDTIQDPSIPVGGTVYLNGEFSYESGDLATGIDIKKNLTIDGGGSTINARNQAAIFNVIGDTHIVLMNITFIGGNSTNGGAINVVSGGSVDIMDCTFINNTATNQGGAIFIDGVLHVTQTTFDNGRAGSGGSIYLNDTFQIYSTIDNSTFINSYVSGDGGAVYVSADNVHMKDLIFRNNTAGDDGGAIYWEGSTGVIDNITCIENKGISLDKSGSDTSSTRGGTICLTGSDVIITKSHFSLSSAYMDENKNYSKVDGGALFITGNNVVVNDTTFDSCDATNNGGAIYVIGNNTHIYNSDFNNCIARDGAALYVDGIGCSVYNSTFTNNIANDDGGAIYWEGDNGVIYNITCINNKGVSRYDPLEGEYSNSKGGTICLTGSNVSIDESSFTQSSSKVDGGTLFITGNDVKVMHSNFTNSISTESSGGAVYIIGNDTHVTDCNFDDCKVDVKGDHRGGAIFVAGNDANITGSTFTNTKALIGGAICIDGDNTVVDGSKFSYNDAVSSAGGSGGAINVNGAHAVITNSEFSYSTAVNYGGAIAVWGPNAVLENNTFNNSKTTKFNGGAVFINGTHTSISLSNFTQCNALGDSYARGGAIDVQGDDTHIINCNFDDCNSRYGGVIYVSGTDADIEDSTFKDSEAKQGGAIYVDGINTCISNSNFTEISADNYGGTIYVAGANANISKSNFIRSTVKNFNGGAIYIAGENTNIEKSNFTSAQALNTRNKALGGAIYIDGQNTVIKESDFEDCSASQGGGAIYAFGNLATIANSTFTSNTAKQGGSIYLTSWGALVTGSNISGSIATETGGGIYVAEGSIQITESNFDDCIARGSSANYGGGAIYINGPDTHISASNFTHNTAPSGYARGGSIFINGERTIIDSSQFENGSAHQGGEIYIEGENAVIDTSEFAGSSSRSAGGSIYVKGDEATIRKSGFDGVYAAANGGAIYVEGEQTDILNSSFYNCTIGGSFGGAIYIDDLGTTVAFSNFTLSKAKEGGAIYIRGENTTITYCNLHNNTANTAGAIKVYGDDTIISNCNFTYNFALTSNGGAMDIGGANASVYYSWFDHNDAKADGGAINWLGGHGDDSIIGSTFTNNVAHDTNRGGGAIYWTQGLPIASGGLIKDCIFINNTAAGRHGGAIDWYQALDSVIDNCLFVNNTSKADGGALYTGDQGGNSVNLTITNSQFYNNTAGKYGGAVANQMANSYIFNNTFDGNKAMAGGGTLLMKEGPADNCVIDHCYIFNSHVEDLSAGYGEGGGAILIGTDSNITISNSAILNSTIFRGPGGAIAIGGSDCSVINVSIQDASTRNDDGGAIYWKGTNGKMNNVTIFNASSHSTDSSKSSNGGAIHISGWYCNADDIKIFQSSANNDENCAKTNYGGAIYVSGSYDVLTNIVIDNSSSTNAKMNAGGGAIFYDGYGGTLINATISNTLATGNGGAIYWKGSAPANISNISITYSQTEVINSTNSADGGAIYTTTVTQLDNVYINGARAYKNSGDVHGGAIYMKDGRTLNNITVIGSRASTDEGTSMGGAVYFTRDRGSSNVWVYNSSFEENNADLGGALFYEKITARVYDSSFIGNVANQDGGAVYSRNEDEYIYNSIFEHNSAKRGGAIFSQNSHIQISDSTLEFNTAEEKGGAIFYNYDNKAGSSVLLRVNLLNNTAFQGSAIYGTKFNKLSLTDVTLLDNQANSNKFTEKAVGVDEEGNNYTSAVFLGFDNLLNGIWQESTYALACTNVTYWGVGGRSKANSPPTQSDREVNINVTVEMYDENGVQLHTEDLVTDKDGKVKYTFKAEEDKTYYFAFSHKTDRYYTWLRDTLSNRSLVKIYVYTPIYYGQNQTILISLTDGAWGNLNGTVIVTFNDTQHTTFVFDVLNGTANKTGISNLPIGHYNATATFAGDINHTGDSDWTIFEVVPYDDLAITKDVNVTADVVNVGDIIKYTVTVTNYGPSKAFGVNVTERLSPYLKLIRSKTTKGSYNLEDGYWYIGELEKDDFETLTIIAEIVHMGPITNTVWVTGLGRDINMSNNVASAHNFTAVPIVDLRISKQINDTRDVINVLDKVQFTVTVVNDGPANATGVVVEEFLDSHLKLISSSPSVGTYEGGTWNIGNLSNGSTATLKIVAQVVYSGNISNSVHVYGYENESNYTNNYASIKNITAVANVDLQINKYVNVSGVVNVTDKIKFTITVTNNGPCNATGVYVAETLSPHLRVLSNTTTVGEWDGSTWIIGRLNEGDVENLTIIAEVISAGTISNAVAIFGNDNDTNRSNNNDSIENITAEDIVDLRINKTVDVTTQTVNVSDIIIFTVHVKNYGPCDATNVNVTEKLSPHLKLISYSTWSSYYDVDEGIWYIGNLTNGDWRDLVIVAEVVSAGTISNVVIVNSTEKDTNKSNNMDEIDNITAKDIVDLQIKKEVNTTFNVINVTDYLKYTITVFNDGPSNATNVNVSEVLSPHLKLIKYETEQGYYNVIGGYWYIGRLNNQSTAVLTIYAQVISNGTISNVVIVNSTENDTDPSNNRDEIDNITAVYIVDLQIRKEVNVSSTDIDITDIVKFTITVYNAGPCNATGVYVNEPLSDILIPTSIVPSQGYYDGHYWIIGNMTSGSTVNMTIIAKIAYAGVIENEVNVTSREIDTNYTNNKDNITPINVSAHVNLGVNKTVSSDVVNVSDLIEFTVVAYNNGPSNASGVYVLEALDFTYLDSNYTCVASEGTTYDGYTWYIGQLDAGAKATLKIVTHVIKAGNFSNYVEIVGFGNDTDKSNNNATVNVTAKPVVDLAINKTVDVTCDVVYFGDRIVFTVTVVNNGPCDATDVNVTEVLDSHLKLVDYHTWDSYYDVDAGVWYIGDLAKGDWRDLVIEARVIALGNITNAVSVTSYENDTNKSNDNASIPNITAKPIVDLQIQKEVNFTGNVIDVTDYIKYTITVFNDGPCNATNVNVSEVLSPHLKLIKYETDYGYYNLTGGYWYIGRLNNQSTAVLTIYVQVISNGTISNVVVVNSTEKDSDPSNNRDEIDNITAIYVVDMQIRKEVNTTETDIDITDVLKFTITVYNAGPCNATGVYVNEPLSDILIPTSIVPSQGYYDGHYWIIGNMTSGSTVNMTIVAKIAYAGVIENEVNVTSREIDTNYTNNKDNITPINVSAHVDRGISKGDNLKTRVVNVGDLVEFTVVAYNSGSCNATGVYVLEALDFHLKLESYDAPKGTTYNGHTWYIGNLNKGDVRVLRIVARVIAPGNFSNYVEIFGYDNDTNPSNDNASVSNVTAKPVVDLAITKDVNVTTGVVYYNDTIKFTITVTNNGPCDATYVNVTEALDSHLELVKWDGDGYYDVDEGVWHIGDVDRDDMAQLEIIARVIALGNITNAVSVNSFENDTNKSNNNDSIPNITAKPIVDLRIQKTVNVSTTDVNVTDIIEFTITVWNDGPCNATNVYVCEPLSDCLEIINVEGPGRYIDRYTWVIGDMANGTNATLKITARIIYSGIIENRVNVTCNDTDINMTNNYDNISPLNATTYVDLAISKTVNVTTGVVVVGDVVEFTIVAYNYGPCNASGVYVLEALDFDHLSYDYTYVASAGTTYDGYTWYIGYLDAGANVTLKITTRVAEPGNFSNYVEIFGYDDDRNKSNNNATVNITANPVVDLEITKEVNVGDEVLVGQTVVFTITVRNNGPCDATNVNVTEVLSPHLEMIEYITWDSYYDVDGGIWYIGNLSKYDWRQIIIVTEVISAGNISNTVSVVSTENDTNKSNNNDTIPNITAKPAVDLQVIKEVNVTSRFVEVYDFIEYIITVYNDGSCNATGVNVTDSLSSYLKYVSSQTEFGYYNSTGGYWYIGNLANGTTANLTIQAQVMRDGSVIPNVAIAHSKENDTNPYNNRDEVIIVALPVVDLRITKEMNITSDEIGVTDYIKFIITVYNDGPCNATGAYVIESLSDKLHLISNVTSQGDYDGYTWNIDNITVGANVSLTLYAQVIYSGNVSNVVVVYAYQNETNYTNNNASVNFTAISNVDLIITKDVNVSGIVNVTDRIKFTVTVTNTGPCNATGVYVSEVLSPLLKVISNETSVGEWDGSTWVIGNLTKGDVHTLTIIAEVISAGNISNFVSITSSDNDTNKSNNNASIENITSVNIVDLAINKTVDVESDVVAIGDRIVFTVTVWNNGPCDATNVNVTEVLDANLKMVSYSTWDSYYDVDDGIWYIGDLAKDDWRQLIIVAEVVSAGNISNVVAVTSTENDTNKSNNNASIPNITAVDVVDLAITKDVNVEGTVFVGQNVIFTVTVRNNGPCDATNVNVTEVLSPHLEMIGYSTWDSYYDVDEGIWYIGNLSRKDWRQLIIVAEVISAGNISNVVVVTSTENDTNMSNNNASIPNITARDDVDLAINKSVNFTGDVVCVGDTIIFTVTVWNDGPCDATNVNVTEALDAHLKLVSYSTWDSYYDVDEGVWYIGDLAKDDWRQLVIVVEVISGGNISNVVVVTSSENDPNKSNNNASIPNITAHDDVDLAITKSVNFTGDVVCVGDTIIFTVTVWNNGPCDATNVNVTEVLSPHLKLVSYSTWDSYYDVDDGVWYIGNLTKGDWRQLIIAAEVISAGNISNVVVVTSSENDSNMSNNNASIPNITAHDDVDLVITKEVNVNGTVLIGQTVIFTVTVRNNGPCDATNVNVTEALDSHLKMLSYSTWDSYYDVDDGVWYIGNLTKGDWRQLIIAAEVISAGNISNVVNVTSSENDSNMSNNNASIPNITAVAAVDLYITKSVNVKSGFVNVTDIIEFDIVVYNAGPCDATNVNVTEVLSPHLKFLSSITENGHYDADAGMWYIGDLANQSRAYLAIFAQVISEGTISNVVVVNSSQKEIDNRTNRDEIENITALPIFDLSIAKTVNATDVNVSDYIRYTITISNAGPCNATDVVVWDKLSDLLEFVSFASTRTGITYDYASGMISVGDLNVNETVDLIIVAKVIGNGTIENAANITGYGTDTNKSNNNDTSDNVTAHPVVDLSISKTYETSTSTDIVIVGDVIVYTITVYNYGPSNATDVKVNETLSRLVDVIEVTATAGFYDPVSGIWDIGNLAKESTATLTIRVKVIGNGTIENVVSVTSYENDTDPSNNNASSDNITALPDVVLNINKEVNVTEVTVGDCIEYTIEISNYGLSDATVYVIDNLSPLLEFVSFDATRTDIKYDSVTGKVTIGKLASSENVVMKIVARVISSGNISNIAVVSSKESIPKNDSSENVTAEKMDTPIILIPENITYGDDETIIVILPDSATGTVNITVNGKAYNDVEINGGIAELLIPDLAGGNYNVTVVYGGDNVYVGNATDGKFNVARAVPIITIEVVDIWHGEIEVLNVTVNAPGTVNITVFGITVEVPLNHSVTSTDVLKAARKASYDGKATWNLINLPVGRYPAFAIYNENENYTSVNTSDVFHVRDKPSTVVVSADDIYVGEDAVVNVQVGPRGVTGNVTLVVDGVTYELNITEDGKASVTVSGLPAGLKDVYVRYNGDILYRPSENSTVFNVLKLTPPIGIDSPDITVGEDGVITVTVPSDATGTITIEIDGKTYTQDIVNGTAVFIVPGLSEGTHDIRAYYSGDDRYLPVNATGSINVNPVKGNDTNENATDIGEVHNGIALSQYATGNPIFILLIILLSVFSRPLRRFRK